MAEYITKIRTAEGDKQIDYNALANLPVIKDYTEDILEAKADVESRIDSNSKRITNLEKGIPNECFVVDASVSYKKDVPANALPYAEIEMIGGMTYKEGNTLLSAPVTEIKSASANLFNPADYISDAVNTTLDGDVFTTTFTNASLHLNPSRTRAFKAGAYTIRIEKVTPTLFASLLVYAAGTYDIIHSASIYDSRDVLINADRDFAIALSGYYTEDASKYGTFSYKIQVVEGDVVLPYAPYFRETFPISEDVKALEGYGEGVDSVYYNRIKWNEDGTRTYHKMVKTITLDGVTYGKMMDGTDPQAAELASYYAYMLPAALAVESGTPCKISHGVFAGEVPNPSDYDVVANTSFVFSLSIKTEILGLGSAPSASEIVAATNKYLNDRYNEGNPVTVTYVLPSASREVIDISDILPGDNHIGVEGNGELTFVNEHGFAVPNEITYMLKEA